MHDIARVTQALGYGRQLEYLQSLRTQVLAMGFEDV